MSVPWPFATSCDHIIIIRQDCRHITHHITMSRRGSAESAGQVDAVSAAMERLGADFGDCKWTHTPSAHATDASLATALQHHRQIHARLQLEILDVREEVARLKGELRRDAGPARMGHIQKQIGVGVVVHGGSVLLLVGVLGPRVLLLCSMPC